jgi:hypothetical protein
MDTEKKKEKLQQQQKQQGSITTLPATNNELIPLEQDTEYENADPWHSRPPSSRRRNAQLPPRYQTLQHHARSYKHRHRHHLPQQPCRFPSFRDPLRRLLPPRKTTKTTKPRKKNHNKRKKKKTTLTAEQERQAKLRRKKPETQTY